MRLGWEETFWEILLDIVVVNSRSGLLCSFVLERILCEILEHVKPHPFIFPCMTFRDYCVPKKWTKTPILCARARYLLHPERYIDR